jgi:hypothetical protein
VDTVEKWEIELDNSCQCSDDDGNLLTDCYGCFDDTLSIVDEMVGQWLENIGFDGSGTHCPVLNFDQVNFKSITKLIQFSNNIQLNFYSLCIQDMSHTDTK